MNTFNANYDGECQYCFETVEAGEQAAFYKDDFMHYLCAVEAQNEDKRTELEKMAE